MLSISAQAIKKHLNCQVSSAMVISVVAVLVAATALARIAQNTVDPVATVSDDGRHIIVTGPIACTKNERAYLLVTSNGRSMQRNKAMRASRQELPRLSL
jgi:hypothetical protein